MAARIGKLASSLEGSINSTVEIPYINEIKTEIYNLSGISGPSSRRDIKDTRSYSKIYSSTDTTAIPPVLDKLVTICKERFVDEDDAVDFTIHYAVGFKNTQTEIPAPANNTVCRFVFNFGNREIYFLNPVSDKGTIDAYLPEKMKRSNSNGSRQLLFNADTFVNLGSSAIAMYEIIIRSVAPQRTPDAITSDRNKQAPITRFIRPSSYHRVTIVVDLLGNKKQMERVNEYISDTMKNMDMKKIQKLASTIPKSTGGPVTKQERKEVQQTVRSDADFEEKTMNPDEIAAML